MLKRRKQLIVVLLILAGLILFTVGLLVGKTLPRHADVSFYAKVVEIQEHSLLVEGIPENDVNHRGAFQVSLTSSTILLDGTGASIPVSGLWEGADVSIVYDGIMLESYPVGITASEVRLLGGLIN